MKKGIVNYIVNFTVNYIIDYFTSCFNDNYISRTNAVSKPLKNVSAVVQWHQKALHHRKFQLLTVSDDHHVRAGQSWIQVIQMDPAVIGHQTHSKI